MTHEERFGEENGILLCREHAALIDIDDSPYPAELLRQWKLMAYKRLQESLAELTTDPTDHRSWSAVRELVRICLCTCQTQGTIVKGARFRSYSGILYQLLFEDLPQEPDYDKQTELWMSAIHKIASDALEPVHCRVSRHDRSFPRHYRYIMEELKKICRVVERELPEADFRKYLVLDATTGQNGVAQAEIFSEAIDLDGIVLTKLDGTAKGGVVIAISVELELPVLYVGVGEKIDDLIPFDAKDFVDALI